MEAVHVNPAGLFTPRGFSHAISVTGPAKTIYFGGQNAVDRDGRVVGAGDLKAQTEQVLSNIETLLEAAGARSEHIVKLGVHLVQGQDPVAGFEAFQAKWGGAKHHPTVTVLFVSGLGRPEWLVEIDGIAVVPED